MKKDKVLYKAWDSIVVRVLEWDGWISNTAIMCLLFSFSCMFENKKMTNEPTYIKKIEMWRNYDEINSL